MSKLIRRRGLLCTGLGLGLSLALPAARACEFFGANLRITHPWARASGPAATTAIVNIKFDEVTQADRLIRVETPVAASARLGGATTSATVSFPIPVGQETLLSEDGTYLLLVGLKHPLETGRVYPLTLVFETAGLIKADLSIDYDSDGHDHDHV